MVPFFDGPFENHLPDVPERDRDRAVTPDRDIKFPIIRTNYLFNIPLGEIRAVFFILCLIKSPSELLLRGYPNHGYGMISAYPQVRIRRKW